ncbi:MAG: hypothetical protein KJZ72_13705 [Anaerolineales bacterium]|nr:hypothetical protein [Anaerolineales bacterium]
MSANAKYSIVFDLDNTIVDTSIRKQKILKKEFDIDISLEEIKKDYYLLKCFGNKESVTYKRFAEILDSSDGIKKFKADSFSNSITILNKLIADGYKIIILSARPNLLIQETTEELVALGLNLSSVEIHLNDSGIRTSDEGSSHKKMMINTFLQTEKILAVVGDRLSDMSAAKENHLPGILFNAFEEGMAYFTNAAGFFIQNDWIDIYNTLQKIRQGNEQIEELRLKMIDQYASFLGDLDNKIILNVTVGVGIMGVSGAIINQKISFATPLEIFTSLLLLFSFLCALISLLYSLQSVTSRHTSGSKAEQPINVKIYNAINILMPNWFQKYKYVDEKDPVKFYEDLKAQSETEKKNAHITYFQETFGTYNPDALLNLRLFALKASNYSKIYPERISTKLLSISVLLISIWVLVDPLIKLVVESGR